MAVSRRGSVSLAFVLLLSATVLGRDARAGGDVCRLVNIEFTPGGVAATASDPELDPQIVAWVEKPTPPGTPDTVRGEFVDTVFITQATGRYGMANRPGRFDFNTGPNWPYGRRLTVFPVWANRQPLSFPQIEFRNGDDNNLSHPADQSSHEPHFCRPLQHTTDALQWDAATCSSSVFTDKGHFGTRTTGYPPRADVIASVGASLPDSDSVEMYRGMNKYDAVSAATPRLGTAAQVNWSIPADVPPGDYVLFVEVSLERDFNTSYSSTRFPAPTQNEIPWSDYGVPYRGQPSVIYRVPFTVGDTETFATTDKYIGYGDPGPDPGQNGKTMAYYSPDATIRPPDDTITTGTPNTGASRLLLMSKDNAVYRIRVDAHPDPDRVAPGPPGAMLVADAAASDATLTFVAPGDDGMIGTVSGYDVRYRVGTDPISGADFDSANAATFTGAPVAAGQEQEIVVHNLLPETTYTFAVRAYDDCHNTSVVTSAEFTTAPRKIGEVDACFIATAAYGSVMANDVEMLRRFRDRMLKHSVLGELAVETYYTFGPTVAGVVGESDLLRSSARGILSPIVRWARRVR